MDRPPPIDLPDDFGLDDHSDRRAISWMPLAFAVVLVIAIGAVAWAVLA